MGLSLDRNLRIIEFRVSLIRNIFVASKEGVDLGVKKSEQHISKLEEN